MNTTRIKIACPTGDSRSFSATLEDGTKIPRISKAEFSVVPNSVMAASFEFVSVSVENTEAIIETEDVIRQLFRCLPPKNQKSLASELRVIGKNSLSREYNENEVKLQETASRGVRRWRIIDRDDESETTLAGPFEKAGEANEARDKMEDQPGETRNLWIVPLEE